MEKESDEVIDLHVHSDGSVLDGSCEIDKLLDEVVRQGENAVAITDHASCIKLYEFYKKATERNIKPILGCEFYCGEKDDDNKYHLILLAKNEIGLKNIFNLLYKGYSNFYYKPRIQYKDLEEHKEGVICLSSCIGGEVSKVLLKSGYDKSLEVAKYFKNLFGDDYYLEIQSNKIPFQRTLNLAIQDMCKLGFNPIVTADAHYVTKEDYDAHDTLLCINVNKKKNDSSRFKFTSNDFYLKLDEEVINELNYLDKDFVITSIKNTHSIADKCNVKIEYSDKLLPKMPGIENEKLELARLCNEGFAYRKGQGHFNRLDIKEVIKRISYELENICSKGYAGYFLIVKDFIDFCKNNNIPIGAGRGSVCGSEIAFILGITEVEPMKYGLLYERFLNPTRNSPPDVDVDVCYEKRYMLIDYIKEKYGVDNTSHIIAEGKMTTKAVMRKVMTAYDYDMKVINQTCKLVDNKCANLKEALQNEELFKRLNGRPELDDMIRLEGLISHASKHAAGVLITPEPVYNIFPVRMDMEEKVPVCEWHKKHIEALGAYKFDLLGLKQLTIFDKTIQSVNKNYNKNLTLKDLFEIDLEDPIIYKVLNEGNLKSIFQFTGDSAGHIINEMKPNCFNDIMVAESICRPGVLEDNLYLSNKKLFNEAGTYPVPTYYSFVKDILDETYGALVYQEQTMLLLHKLGGFSLGEADGLRKVKSLEPYREQFVNSCTTLGMTVQEANELFDRFDLGYSFNKSHACVYGVNSAICCWLLGNYPKEFLSASMTLELTQDKCDIKGFMKEVTKLGINILPPDINVSENEFKATVDGIKFPLNVIKQVGKSAYESIIKYRPYDSLKNFLEKVPKSSVKKNIVINLIKAGCFDEFNPNRSILLSDFYNYRNEDVDVYYWCNEVQMMYENETLGFSLGKHPLDGYTSQDIKSFKENDVITIIGLVNEVKDHIDKNKKNMAFLKLENKMCEFEGIVFSYAYTKLSRFLYKGAKLGLTGKKQGNTILINNIWEV